MNCKSVKTWLLQAESLRCKTWPQEIGTHVDGCAVCAKVARDLRELEDTWREQQVPGGAKKARLRFLKKLPKIDLSVPARAAVPGWIWKTIPWAAAAAMFVVGIGIFAWLLSRSPSDNTKLLVDNRASTQVVDRILDWHLELTNAEPKDRKRLVDDNEPVLRQDLQKARPFLSPEETELAEDFLDDGVSLAAIDDPDPLEEADRAQVLAEKILSKSEVAKKKGNDRASERCHLHYYVFMDRAVNPLFERIAKMKPPEPKKDWKKDGKGDGKKGPSIRVMTPPQFQQRQEALRKSFEAMRKKGFGHKR